MEHKMRPANRNDIKILLSVIGGMAIFFIISASVSHAQQAEKAERRSSGSLQLKETEITGKLKDALGPLKLLETEINGTVERPGLNYSLPWKDPDPLPLEDGKEEGRVPQEIYIPLDKEKFTDEIRSGVGR